MNTVVGALTCVLKRAFDNLRATVVTSQYSPKAALKRGWARNLMSYLLDAGLIEVNARGHYHVQLGAQSQVKPHAPAEPTSRNPRKSQGKIIADDYFHEEQRSSDLRRWPGIPESTARRTGRERCRTEQVSSIAPRRSGPSRNRFRKRFRPGRTPRHDG